MLQLLGVPVNSLGQLVHFLMKGPDGIRAYILGVVVVIRYLFGGFVQAGPTGIQRLVWHLSDKG